MSEFRQNIIRLANQNALGFPVGHLDVLLRYLYRRFEDETLPKEVDDAIVGLDDWRQEFLIETEEKLVIRRFEMTALEFGLADEINAAHERVAQCLSEGLGHATRAGELLLRAKADVGHGGWLKWLKQNVSFSTRTAQVYMQISKLAPDAQRVAHLPLRRTVLELQRLDRDARRQADRQEQGEEARRDQHSAGERGQRSALFIHNSTSTMTGKAEKTTQ